MECRDRNSSKEREDSHPVLDMIQWPLGYKLIAATLGQYDQTPDMFCYIGTLKNDFMENKNCHSSWDLQFRKGFRWM